MSGTTQPLFGLTGVPIAPGAAEAVPRHSRPSSSSSPGSTGGGGRPASWNGSVDPGRKAAPRAANDGSDCVRANGSRGLSGVSGTKSVCEVPREIIVSDGRVSEGVAKRSGSAPGIECRSSLYLMQWSAER